MAEGPDQTEWHWREWYARYDVPDSSRARRLTVVRRRVAEALAEPRGPGPIRILSACSGDGRDLLPELAACDRDVAEVVLVEIDANLAENARENARGYGARSGESD